MPLSAPAWPAGLAPGWSRCWVGGSHVIPLYRWPFSKQDEPSAHGRIASEVPISPCRKSLPASRAAAGRRAVPKPLGDAAALSLRDERAEQARVAHQVHVPEVVLANMGLRGQSHPGCLGLVAEQEADYPPERLQVGGIWQQDAGALGDLVDDPAGRRADHGPALPRSLGHGS